MNIQQDGIAQIVRRAINDDVERIIAEEANAAAERVAARIRANCATLVMTVMNRFSVEQMRDEVTIRVDTRDLENITAGAKQ